MSTRLMNLVVQNPLSVSDQLKDTAFARLFVLPPDTEAIPDAGSNDLFLALQTEASTLTEISMSSLREVGGSHGASGLGVGNQMMTQQRARPSDSLQREETNTDDVVDPGSMERPGNRLAPGHRIWRPQELYGPNAEGPGLRRLHSLGFARGLGACQQPSLDSGSRARHQAVQSVALAGCSRSSGCKRL